MGSRHTRAESRLERRVEVLKALGNPVRFRILELLYERPRTVLVLSEALGLPQTAVSRELANLRAKRVVCGTRDGYFIRYSIVDPLALGLMGHLAAEPAQSEPPAGTGIRARSLVGT